MIYVALAAYNEEENIGGLLDGIAAAAAAGGFPIACVVVNDGSLDGTERVVRSRELRMRIDLVNQPNAGFLAALGRALGRVVEIASDEDVCVTMDADNTHDPRLLTALSDRIARGADIAIASRYREGGRMVGVPAHRLLLSWGARFVMKLFVPVKNVRDYSTAYRAYRVGLLRRGFVAYGAELVAGEGFSGMAGLLIRLARLTERIDEVPLVLRYDLKRGASTMNVMKTTKGYLRLILGNLKGEFRPRG